MTEQEREGGTADLTNSWSVLFDLLENGWTWRQRLVQSLEFRDAWHVRLHSSFQVEIPGDVLDVPGDNHGSAKQTSVRLLVPLGTRPKRNLLRFDCRTGTGDPALVLPRAWIADVESEYLGHLLSTREAAPVDTEVLTKELLYAICVATPDRWEGFRVGASDPVVALQRYLESALKMRVPLDRAAAWSEMQREAGRVLSEALDEPADLTSSSENILLAVPELREPPATVAELDALVRGYRETLEGAADGGRIDFLQVLAEYGRRYELVLDDVLLPLGRPALIKTVEDVPIRLTEGGEVVVRLPFVAAKSVHIEARSADHQVTLGLVDVRDVYGRSVGSAHLESRRLTDETVALYSSTVDRPYLVDLVLRLRAAPSIEWTAVGVTILTLSSVVGILASADGQVIAVSALLTLPVGFAASLVLTRRQSPLSSRLERPRRRGECSGWSWSYFG